MNKFQHIFIGIKIIIILIGQILVDNIVVLVGYKINLNLDNLKRQNCKMLNNNLKKN